MGPHAMATAVSGGPSLSLGPCKSLTFIRLRLGSAARNGEWAVGGNPRAAVIRADRCHHFSELYVYFIASYILVIKYESFVLLVYVVWTLIIFQIAFIWKVVINQYWIFQVNIWKRFSYKNKCVVKQLRFLLNFYMINIKIDIFKWKFCTRVRHITFIFFTRANRNFL